MEEHVTQTQFKEGIVEIKEGIGEILEAMNTYATNNEKRLSSIESRMATKEELRSVKEELKTEFKRELNITKLDLIDAMDRKDAAIRGDLTTMIRKQSFRPANP